MGELTAAGKALAVLGAFSRTKPTLNLSQIANRTGMPLSTAHRVVNELADWGALERDPSGEWHIGLRLWETGALCPRGQILREVALPSMEDLYEATHENVQLAVREGSELVFIERIMGHRSSVLRVEVATRIPLAPTALGLVLLAYAPTELQDEVLAGDLVAHTPHTVTDPRELRRRLAEVRRNTYALSDRQLSPDRVAIAAPVRLGPKGPVHAALAIIVEGTSTEVVRPMWPRLQHAAARISRALGERASAII